MQTSVVMLNHSLGFKSPLFLTANHCLQLPKPPTLLWNHYMDQGVGSVWPLITHGRVVNYNGRVTHSQRPGLPLRHFLSSDQQ